MTESYRIFAEQSAPHRTTGSEIAGAFVVGSCAAIVALAVVGAVAGTVMDAQRMSVPEQQRYTAIIWWTGGTIAVAAFIVAAALFKRSARRHADAEAQRQAEAAAASLTHQLHRNLASNLAAVDDITQSLREAAHAMTSAEREIMEHGYTPFWDNMETAATMLGRASNALRVISRNKDEYKRTLAGWRHNFPPVAIAEQQLPDPRIAADRLQRIFRIGVTTFEFAIIWEQRRVQKVANAEYRTAGDLMGNVSRAVIEAYQAAAESS